MVNLSKGNIALQNADTLIVSKDGNRAELKGNVSFAKGSLNNVLMILDGKKVANNILETLDPNLIQSVDVLKNESATVAYGDEGKNGVVIITTKEYAKARTISNVQKNEEERKINGSTIAQTPAGINFQAVVRDQLDNPAKNRKVFVKDMIIEGTVTGKKVLEEVHEVQTNEDGIFSLLIGSGSKSAGSTINSLEQVDWANGPYFFNFKVALVPSIPAAWWVTADNYIDMGTTEMKSLPKAIIKTEAPNPFLITDKNGDVHWEYPTYKTSPKKYPDTLKWVRASSNDSSWVNWYPASKRRLTGYPTNVPVIIDGVRGDMNSMNSVTPAEISSITVLKDKTAVEKYGEEGKKGVIEIITKKAADAKNNTDTRSDVVFTEVQIQAEFPGGNAAWIKYLERNLQRDIIMKNGGPRGNYTVVVSFIVDKAGNVSDVKAENDPGYGTKNEAIRVVANGPKWKSAVQNGKNVNSVRKQSVTWQSVNWVAAEKTNTGYIVTTDDKIMTTVQIPAEFPGGQVAWQKYLERNLNRNIVVDKGGPPGKYTVMVSFIVDKVGNVSDVKAENDPGFGTKDEAVKLIVKGPKWKPAVQNGKNVISVRKQPITWVVSGGTANSNPVKDQPRKNIYYYFCDSKPWSGKNLAPKSGILYTEIKKIVGDESVIKALTNEWANLVRNTCTNTNGCTSDLNYYENYEDAKKQFDNMLKRYNDTALYDCRKIPSFGSAFTRAKLDPAKSYEPQ